MKIRVENLAENEQNAEVGTRNRNTGQDNPGAVTLEPGDSAELEISEDNVPFFSASAPPPETAPALQVAEPVVTRAGESTAKADSVELTDASDDDLKAVYAEGKDADGKYDVRKLNDALAAKGFKPVNAARRDALMAG